jgi:hypothetical protein
MTNWELAQAMVRLGAVTASALDGGGSTAMAFDGKLLNRPSDRGGERPVAETLAVLYSGVYAPTPCAAGRLPERRRHRRATAALLQGGAHLERDREPRRPRRSDRLHGHRHARARRHQLPVAEREQEEAARTGPFTLRGRSEDAGSARWTASRSGAGAGSSRRPTPTGRESSVERAFWLNDTLGFIRVAPRSVKLRKKTRTAVVARFRLANPARVTPSIWTTRGTLIPPAADEEPRRRHPCDRLERPLPERPTRLPRHYVFKVFAQNAYGPVDLNQRFVVRR